MIDISISNKDKLSKIISIFKNLNKITEHVNIHFSKNYMYIQGKCSISVCILEINLISSWFDAYKVDNDEAIGVNSEVLFKVISCISDNQTLHMKHKDESDIMEIVFEGDNTIEKAFELQLVDLDEDVLDVPFKEHEVDIKIKSNVFSDLVNQLKMFGEDATISCSDENVSLGTNSVSGKLNIILNEDNLIEYGIEEELKLRTTVSLNYLHIISLYSKITNETNIHVSENFPLEVRYNVEGSWMDDSDSDEDGEDDDSASDFNTKNMVRFFLAPKIDD